MTPFWRIMLFYLSMLGYDQLTAQDSLGAARQASLLLQRSDSSIDDVRRLQGAADTIMAISGNSRSTGLGIFSNENHTWEYLSHIPELTSGHPLYNFIGSTETLVMERKIAQRDETLFYVLCALLFFYGITKVAFFKYHENLFRIFFRSTLRSQQLSEQLIQTPWPSLMLNMLFVCSGGLYAAFLCRYFGVITHYGLWQLMLYFSLAFILIYSGKYFLLKLFGWTLGMTSLTNGYIFTVFMVNKMAGILLLPVLLLLSFPFLQYADWLVPFSLVLLLVLLFYRFMQSFLQVRNEIRLNFFHFFIYLCGFEMAPLLVSFKVLLLFVEQTY